MKRADADSLPPRPAAETPVPYVPDGVGASLAGLRQKQLPPKGPQPRGRHDHLTEREVQEYFEEEHPLCRRETD